MRSRGRKRPISLVDVIKDAKKVAMGMKVASITKYFKVDKYENPLQHHQAVPLEDVKLLNNFMKSGIDQLISFKDACFILRRKLFPFYYDPHPWVIGRPETNGIYRMEVERLRSLSDDPANFSNYLYQPEIGEGSCELVHHREDHNHLLKRIVSCLRDGRISGIDLRYMREALHDPNTGLTYEALTGGNKQSVPDCERLISPGVIACLEKTTSLERML